MDLGGFKVLRKDGWSLNPDDRVVNGILKGLARNGGRCPCDNRYAGDPDGRDICPCHAYREEDSCCCTLYVPDKTE